MQICCVLFYLFCFPVWRDRSEQLWAYLGVLLYFAGGARTRVGGVGVPEWWGWQDQGCPLMNKFEHIWGSHVSCELPVSSESVVTWDPPPLWTEWQTDTIVNITFPQLRWLAVMILRYIKPYICFFMINRRLTKYVSKRNVSVHVLNKNTFQ